MENRDLKTVDKLKTTDVDSLTTQLRGVFRQLQIAPDEYENALRRYRDRLRNALPKPDQKRVGRLSLTAEANLISILQVNDILDKWRDNQRNVLVLFEELNNAIGVINEYFTPKWMSFSSNRSVVINVIVPGSTGGSRRTRRIAPEHLSSGESSYSSC